MVCCFSNVFGETETQILAQVL